MEEEPISGERPVVRPPDVAKVVIPPPDLPKPDLPLPPPMVAAPPVKVTIREPGDEVEVIPAGGNVPFNTRVLAALLDIAVGIGLQLAAVWVLPSFAERIGSLVGVAYLVTRDTLPFLGGQSIGKKAMKIRVLTMEGEPITGKWETGVLRNIALVIPFFALVELIVLLTREDKPDRGRRLGDEWAKTKLMIEETPVEEKEVS